ncbi:MAG: hypothetical protein Q9173_002459 [Seirophora scorigena]
MTHLMRDFQDYVSQALGSINRRRHVFHEAEPMVHPALADITHPSALPPTPSAGPEDPFQGWYGWQPPRGLIENEPPTVPSSTAAETTPSTAPTPVIPPYRVPAVRPSIQPTLRSRYTMMPARTNPAINPDFPGSRFVRIPRDASYPATPAYSSTPATYCDAAPYRSSNCTTEAVRAFSGLHSGHEGIVPEKSVRTALLDHTCQLFRRGNERICFRHRSWRVIGFHGSVNRVIRLSAPSLAFTGTPRHIDDLHSTPTCTPSTLLMRQRTLSSPITLKIPPSTSVPATKPNSKRKRAAPPESDADGECSSSPEFIRHPALKRKQRSSDLQDGMSEAQSDEQGDSMSSE